MKRALPILACVCFICVFAVLFPIRPGEEKLLKAIQANEVTNVIRMISNQPRLLQADLDDRNGKVGPLSVAAGLGKEQIVRKLIQLGANVNAQDRCKETPLYVAIESGQTNIVLILLKHGADPKMEANSGRSCIQLAKEVGMPLPISSH